MADRKSLFSRFWPASASRRASATQTTASPPTESQPVNQKTKTSATRAKRPTTTAGNSPPSPATQSQPRKSPPSQVQSASNKDEPKTASPSSSKPPSPNRKVAQSRSPPQPYSPSQTPSPPKRSPQPRSPSRSNKEGFSKPASPNRRVAQSRSPPQPPSSSRTPSTQQMAPQPRSPKEGSSAPSKGSEPTSPLEESRQPTQEIPSPHETPVSASDEKDPKPAAYQQEPQSKAEVKSDTANDDQTLDETSFKHNSQSSEVGTTNGEDKPLIELNAKPEETKDVKEVVQATNAEAKEEMKEEVEDFHPPKSGPKEHIIEKAEIPSTQEPMEEEKKEALQTKEIVAASLPSATMSQPKKRSTISGTHDKSAVSNGGHVPLHRNIRDNKSTSVNQMAVGNPIGAIYDGPVSVVTLVGENRGASLQIESNSSKRERPVHIHRSYKINPDETGEATTDGEGSSDQKKAEDADPADDQPTETYVNNNAQGINNSIVFNSSVTEGDPGVHMVVTHLPKELNQSTEKGNPSETRKTEFNMKHMEKLTYQPTIRRRCLRGLLLETSDSDLENPDKPRSHGCRVGCQKMDKEDNMDVL